MATPPPIISLLNLSKTYLLGNIPVHALDNISLSVPKGQIVFIVGPSGSGKTTLLNLVGGIDSPTTGQIEVAGAQISSYSDRKLTQYRKKHLAFVFQFYSLIPTLTAIENVELSMELRGVHGRELHQGAKKYLQMVQLDDRMFNFPSQLSGGERQRVAIARALAKDPDILLIDEPTGQLDHETGMNIVALIHSIAREYHKTVLLVTHDLDLTSFAERIIELRSGKIITDTVNPNPSSIKV